MASSPAPALAAGVLAGGRSTRMGRDKAFLPWPPGRLLDRQIEVLRAMQPDELLLSGRPGVDYGRPDLPVVVDEPPDAGPLAGLCALFAATRAPLLLVLAVDMPAVEPSFLQILLDRCRPGVGVVPVGPAGLEPLAAVYPRSCHARAREHLHFGRRALRDWVHAAAAAGELTLWAVGPAHAPAFANWNQPADLPPPAPPP